MNNRLSQAIFISLLTICSMQKMWCMEPVSCLSLHPALAATAVGGLGFSLGALHLINKRTKQLEEANTQKSIESHNPTMLKHSLRGGVLSFLGFMFSRSENSLHGINCEIPTHKLAFVGRTTMSLGLGLGMLCGTDALVHWATSKLGESKCKPYVAGLLRITGYAASLYMGAIALVDSYGLSR